MNLGIRPCTLGVGTSHHRVEETSAVGHQRLGRVTLADPAILENNDTKWGEWKCNIIEGENAAAVLPVVVHDGVETVGNGDDGGASELLSNGPLDECVRVHVDGGSRFVQHQHLRLAQQCSRQAHQLSLSHAETRD